MKKFKRQILDTVLKHLSGEKGITLVETLVAIAILGICVTTFVLALSTGTLSVRMQDEDARARGLADSQMEIIKAAAYDPSGLSYSVISTPQGYSISINTDSALYSDNRIQKITVAVSLDGSNVYSLEGYKVDR